MFKEYRTRKESGSIVWINLKDISLFRPGRINNYTYEFEGTDIWMKSGGCIWIDMEPEEFARDLEEVKRYDF